MGRTTARKTLSRSGGSASSNLVPHSIVAAAAVLVLSGGAALVLSGWKHIVNSADTEAVERLVALGDGFDAIVGTAGTPRTVPRIQWDPNEPLAAWLGKLSIPVVFNNSEIEHWAARKSWDFEFMERVLPDTITADVSTNPSSGTMVYRENKMSAVTLAKTLGNTVGVRTHTAKQLPKHTFFEAIRAGRPFMRYGGGLKKWVGGENKASDLEHDVNGWKSLAGLTSMPDLIRQLDRRDLTQLQPRRSQLDARQLDIWVGGAGVRSSAHFDPHNNVFVQLHGTKRFVLSPPSDCQYFDMFPTTHPHSRQAQTQHYLYGKSLPKGFYAAEVDANTSNPVSAVRAVTVDLAPGELLWLPAFWVHAAEAMTPTISVSVVAPAAETILFENLQDGGLLWTMPFLNETTDGWDVPRLATALRVFIPALLEGLRPRLQHWAAYQSARANETHGVVQYILRRMWSLNVRHELGVNGQTKFPCGETSDGDRKAALEAVPRAIARFAPIRNETLPIFVTMYVELLHSHIKLPLGINFLEQCLDQVAV